MQVFLNLYFSSTIIVSSVSKSGSCSTCSIRNGSADALGHLRHLPHMAMPAGGCSRAAPACRAATPPPRAPVRCEERGVKREAWRERREERGVEREVWRDGVKRECVHRGLRRLTPATRSYPSTPRLCLRGPTGRTCMSPPGDPCCVQWGTPAGRGKGVGEAS